MEKFIEVGMGAAREAGKLLMERFHSTFAVMHKGAINLVTEVDIAAENLIVSRIRAAFPHHSILAEENHAAGGARGPYTWIIDPLDGTTNYAHGFPVFAVTIALEIEGRVEWGVVYHPAMDEEFTARSGQGAYCGGERIRVSQTVSLGFAMLATGFPYDIRTSEINNLDNFRTFALHAQAIRRTGSAAIDLSYVAAGRFDGFWELKLHPWDCAAGYLLVREAGGIVTNFKGDPGSIYDQEVVASNGLIHKELLDILNDGSGEA
jgi:myo-inositol-1(or 4)-monophosphatase